MKMITWVKPSGLEIQTNDNPSVIEYAKSLGWTEKKAKRGPKPKAKTDDRNGE